MPIEEVSKGAFFVVDTFSYRARIHEYDPLATSQTLLAFGDEPEGGVAVLQGDFVFTEDDDDRFGEVPETPVLVDEADEQEEAEAREELKRITPPNAELLKLADRFPAPQEWYDE